MKLRLLSLLMPVCLLLPAVPALGTDLGKEGNVDVARRFGAWCKGSAHLRAPEPVKEGETAPRRVMITGFGLFSGVEFNISGVVVESMADAKFWPGSVQLDDDLAPAPDAIASPGVLQRSDGGARVWQRTLTIDGSRYEVGFLLLDVLWDLGAAIVLHEATRFQPDLILMTGRGGSEAVLEGGSVNHAVLAPGFRADGKQDPNNRPTTAFVLDPSLTGVKRDIAATWDNARLAEAIRPLLPSIAPDIPLLAPPAGRADNAYICNNITNVVLHGLEGVNVALAGGSIYVRTDLQHTKAGFFHYPASAKREPAEVFHWARVMATIIDAHFAGVQEADVPEADVSEADNPEPDAPEPDEEPKR